MTYLPQSERSVKMEAHMANRSKNRQICFIVNPAMLARIDKAAAERADWRVFYDTQYAARDNWLRWAVWNTLGRNFQLGDCPMDPHVEERGRRAGRAVRARRLAWTPIAGELVDPTLLDNPTDAPLNERYQYVWPDGRFITLKQIQHNIAKRDALLKLSDAVDTDSSVE